MISNSEPEAFQLVCKVRTAWGNAHVEGKKERPSDQLSEIYVDGGDNVGVLKQAGRQNGWQNPGAVAV